MIQDDDDDDDVPDLVENFDDVAADGDEDSEGSSSDEDSDDEPPELVESQINSSDGSAKATLDNKTHGRL